MTTKFTQDHEWLKLEDDIATVGVTDYAQSQLGDLVFVELPKVGIRFKKGDAAAVVESVKAASDVYMPLAGEVVEVNSALSGEPGLVNTDPQGGGWLFKIRLDNKAEIDGLMNEADYKSHIA